jgi:peptidoglycan/xylan/chitin deacetylase (PgdA/CDA1 family)
MKIKPLIGAYGKVPILIRDDDTNFFTRPDMLETIHSKAWDKGFKISISVVPFQKGEEDVCVPPEIRHTGLLYPIANNEGLVRFLREKIQSQLIEILQHGFSHSVLGGFRGEFGINISEHNANLQSARKILMQAFGVNPRFFAPPYDDISNFNLRLVRQQDMIPIYGQENIHKFFRSRYIPRFYKRKVAKQIFSKFGKSAFIVPVYVNPNKKGMVVSLPHVDRMDFEKLVSLDSFLNSISKVISYSRYNRHMALCIINHYHQYFYDWSHSVTRSEMFKIWHKLLDCLGDLTFGWKTTFLELYNRAMKVQKINISKTGSKITVESADNELMNEVSFQINGRIAETNENTEFEKETNIVTIKQILPRSKFVFYVND